jgi:polysaccharide biosynthesis protein PslJ
VTSRAFAGGAGPWPGAVPAAGSERRLWIAVGLAVTIVVGLAVADGPANLALGVIVVGFVVAAYQRVLLAWPTLLGLILAVILFIPIRRYTVSGNLPFELEPYRILIAVVLFCWLCGIAADPRVRLRASGLEAPIGALLVAMLLSLVVNLTRVNAAGAMVIKNFTFFLSYVLVLYFVVSVVRARRDVDRMIVLLVGGGTILSVAALIEWRTSTNLFNWYSHAAPFLHYIDEGIAQTRGSGFRARASAQHPIALTAALVMLLPLALYLYQRQRRRIWLVCGALMTLGALSTGSRTGMIMLLALLVSFLCIRFKETVRLMPLLLPMLVVIQVAMPGTLGTMKSMLNPTYLIKEQSYDQGGSAGRAADLGPALDRWAMKPFLGSGFGTTVADPTAPKESEKQILDDQWLGSLLEIGAIGALSLLWLFVRAVRRLNRAAKTATGADAWLATSLAAAIISFAVGMLTFDAFAFIQVTFFAFILLALSAVAVRALGRPERSQALTAVR